MSRTVIGIVGIALSMLASAMSVPLLGSEKRSPSLFGVGEMPASTLSRDVVRNIQP